MHIRQGLAENYVVESGFGVVEQVRLCITLDDGQSPADTGVHAVLANLDAPAVDIFLLCKQLEQRAVAATYIKQARTRLDHVGNELMVAPDRRLRVARIGGH